MDVRKYIEEKEKLLSPRATKSFDTVGRKQHEELDPIRTEFQRDRDRIIHSKAFRRLKHKTQVFIAPTGDHYVTRLTHTLEVSQIARTLTRALNLNEDLSEAISLAHDLGHTPFGHVGEAELNDLLPNGFRHAAQSLRTVDLVEKQGNGLNLTWEVRNGIVNHSKPKGDFLSEKIIPDITLEGQIVRISDAVAYLNHDLGDAFRAGVLSPDEIPKDIIEVLGDTHAKRINTLVNDLVLTNENISGFRNNVDLSKTQIQMSKPVKKAMNDLRDFMFEKVYEPEDISEQGNAARRIVRALYEYFQKNPSAVSENNMTIVDFISGMTDYYAVKLAESINPQLTHGIEKGRGINI
ncbi:MAG: deoxyguanosinetriphosphate triphosphohydrolase [Chloroflexi bacterium]|nr:deoxyguanosinetriphosphate triphosphohydrolase [Chloroflexota bacterium]|tara:strand:- start:2950 stop:4002 length:1053 start_codon:yes stop_codon:yes gene_type:complete